MQPRINYLNIDSGALKAINGIGDYVNNSGLDRSLLDLILIRASQINRCAYCLDMHTKDARASGETEQRLYSLNAWRETPFYSARECAALAWTEAVTLLSENGVSDELYAEVQQYFSEDEIVKLTMAVIAINSYNRLNVTVRAVPGHYKSQRQPVAATA